MNNLTEKLAKITLLVLLAVSLVFTAMFWLGGGSEVVINGETWNEPTYTGAFLNWTYVLCGIAIVLTLGFSLYNFVLSFIANPKGGIKTIAVLAVFAAIFVISWYAGTGERLEIIGYEGTDNEGFWAQYADMCIYVTYTMIVATIAALFGTALYAKFK